MWENENERLKNEIYKNFMTKKKYAGEEVTASAFERKEEAHEASQPVMPEYRLALYKIESYNVEKMKKKKQQQENETTTANDKTKTVYIMN